MTLELLLYWGIVCILLVLSAFCSLSETALTSASRSRIFYLAKQGNVRAQLVHHMRKESEALIGAILLGNNLANIAASAIATAAFVDSMGAIGVLISTIFMTTVILIFCEVLPKTYAFRHADSVSLMISPVVQILYKLFSPIMRLIQAFVNFLTRFNKRRASDQGDEEELRGAIELQSEGHERGDRRAMLHSILDLETVTVEEIMVHRKYLEALDIKSDKEEILAHILTSPHTRIPLWDGRFDNIVGILHTKSVFRHIQDGGAFEVKEIMTPPWFIPESTTLRDQLKAFRERKEHFALVVDEYGGLMGIVTLEDVLEEIVGEIADEYDLVDTEVRAESDGSYIVNGTATIRDLNREYEWGLSDEYASTIAGFVLYESRKIPEVGEGLTYKNLRLEVLKRRGSQITSVRIKPCPTETRG